MKLWMKKISVILITIMTLGMYIPPTYLTVNADSEDEASSKASDLGEERLASESESEQQDVSIDELEEPEALNPNEMLVHALSEQAKQQTISKLGPRIANQIEEEFLRAIMPSIEEVLGMIIQNIDEKDLVYYGISEEPSEGYGEKIFHLYNYQTNQDVVRFHVRRDLRPQEGYWFNFHYHMSTDHFETHYPLGEIYWDKNTPPKWMS